MFKIRGKTDEVSSLPFSTVKMDFPCNSVTYVLKHELESSSGRYTGGRCTRWARHLNRHYDRIVRCMFRFSDGPAYTDNTQVRRGQSELPQIDLMARV